MRTLRRSVRRAALLAAVGGLVAAGTVVIALPQAGAALPAGCTTTFTGAVNSDWGTAGNWSSGVPGASSIACIPAAKTVDVNGTRTVQALHLDANTDVFVDSGDTLFVNGPTVSEWAENSQVTVTDGRLGGTGRIELAGLLEFFGHSALTSINAPGGSAYAGTAGYLLVQATGFVGINDRLDLYTRYTLAVVGEAVINSNSLISADWGTRLVVGVGGRFEIDGDGGIYQGNPVTGQSIAFFGNHGVLAKTLGGSTSVVDVDYQPSGSGHVEVDCCAMLALAGTRLIGGQVVPGFSLGTRACGTHQTTICNGSTDPAVDRMSMAFDLPGSNSTTDVKVQELGNAPATTDSRAIGNDVYAHADVLDAPASDPARLRLRYSQADVMASPVDEIQVGHIDDVTGVMTRVPDCDPGPALPTGAPYCLDRASLAADRTAQNTFINVLTTETSRWRVRRVLAGDFEQTATSRPRALKAGLAAPGDGAKVKLTWTAPADDGGAAPKAYRIFRDGALAKTTSSGATSAVVPNNGPGKHTFQVQAVNVAGTSPKSASVAIKLAKISRPRNVAGVAGAAGGKLTAGAKWKPPASAGGYVIKSYQVNAYKAGGGLVATKIVKAGKRKWLFTLRPGRYVFKVRAKNAKVWGPWSPLTTAVRPR